MGSRSHSHVTRCEALIRRREKKILGLCLRDWKDLMWGTPAAEDGLSRQPTRQSGHHKAPELWKRRRSGPQRRPDTRRWPAQLPREDQAQLCPDASRER